jgi:hypothetical protein
VKKMPKLTALAVTDSKMEKPQSILIYGGPFTGKTSMAMELANHGYRIWFLDLDAGALVGLNVVKPENWDKVMVANVPDTPQNPVGIRTVGRFFSKALKDQVIKICEKHGEVACVLCKPPAEFMEFPVGTFDSHDVVVVDNCTTFARSALNQASQETIKKLESKFQKVEWDNYNYQGMLLDNVFSNMKRCKFHRIFISHEDVVEAADGTEKIYPIGGTRSYSRNVAKDFDHVVRLRIENKQHKGVSSTTGSNTSIQGSRTGGCIEKGDTLIDLLKGKVRPMTMNMAIEVEVSDPVNGEGEGQKTTEQGTQAAVERATQLAQSTTKK